MSLPLKIKIQKTNQTKVVKFAPNMSVAECIRAVQEKGVDGGTDHGLFQPLGPKNPARWLRNDRTLQYYDLQPNDELEYKKRHRPLKIKLMDDTIKTILVDDTLSVGEIVMVIGDKMSISNAEEFSLKVEGKADWLNHTQSLHEQGVGEDAMLLFQKKFYVSDQLVSTDDPVALHLVYIQSRDAILAGDHPCTQDEAISFGALQCQILYGNYDPAKNRKFEEEKLLPPQWRKKKLDEKVVRDHKKFVGMTEANAKYRFVQLCRSLKTYGITFFNCKQKTKATKKPKPIRLGVTRDSIIFMDDETKEIFKEAPIQHLRRWAAAPTTFTLDFGDHENDYFVLETKEGEAISSLLAGYIDILLKKQKQSSVVVRDDSENIAIEEPIAPITSSILTSITMQTIKGFNSGTMNTQSFGNGGTMMRMAANNMGMAAPTSLSSAQTYVGTMVGDWKQSGQTFARNMNMSTQQWRSQLVSNTNAVMSSVAKLSAALPPNALDKGLLDSKAAEIAANLAQLISAARNAAFKNNGEDDPNLLAGAKMVADAIKDLLAASKDLADKPNDPKVIERYNAAQKSLQAAVAYLSAANKGKLSDDPSLALLAQSAKNVFSCVEDLLATTRANNQSSPGVLNAADQTKQSNEHLQTAIASLAPAIMDASCKSQLNQVCKALETSIGNLLQTAKTSGDSTGLAMYAKDITDALSQLLSAANIAEAQSVLPDFTKEAREMFEELTRLGGAQGNPGQIIQSSKAITALSSKIAQATREAANLVDDETKERLLAAVKGVAAATQKLVQNAQQAAQNPDSIDAHRALQEACQRLAEATRSLVGDAVEKAAMKNLRSAAKIAAGSTTGLISYARASAATCSDPTSGEALRANSKQAAEAIANLVRALETAWKNPDDQAAQEALIREVTTTCPQAYKLVAAARSAVPNVTDVNNKNFLRTTASEAAEALQKLVEANKALVVSSGQALIDQALERFAAEESHLVSALMDVDTGTLDIDPHQTPDGASQLLNLATRQVAGAIKTLATTAKTNSDDLGNASLVVADAITQTNTAARALAGTIPEKAVQRSILNAAKELTVQARNALASARSVAANPTDPNLNSLLANSARSLAEALAALLAAAKGISTVGKECDDAVAAIANAMRALTAEVRQGNPKDFPSYAEDLENSIKAVQASAQLLYSAAKNNPKAVGSSSKSTASTVAPLISAATLTAGACNLPDTRKAIVASAYESAQAITELIGSAKQAINRANDPSLLENLGAAVSNVNSSLDKLLNALSSATPAQKQLSDAVEEIMRAVEKLSQPPTDLPDDMGASIEQIKAATTKLGEATKGVISASRTNPDQMGGYAKHASSAVSTIVGASMVLASSQMVSSYAEEATRVKQAADELVMACSITDPMSLKQQVIKAAKDITIATQALSETVRRDAAQTSDPSVQQYLNFTGQTLAAATSAVVTAAKGVVGGQPGAVQQVNNAYSTLTSVVDDLLAKDPNQTVSAKANKLLNLARDAATSTSIMIENSRNVHKRPSDSEALAELSQSARSVGAAIKGLLDAARAIGEIDLEEAITKISQAVSDLDQGLISSTVGLLENTAPANKTTQNLEEDLVEVSRNLAGSIKALVQEKDSPVGLAKAARATADFIPEIAKIASQIAGLSTNVDKQQETLGIAKSIADATLLLANACKQNDIKEIVTQAKESSQAIAKMLSTLKGGVIALRECDEASKVIAESLGPLASYNINAPIDRAVNYAESQRELTSLAKELVAAIASTANVAKTRPVEVGEGAKKIAGIIQRFSAAAVDSLATIDSVDSRKDLLSASQNVFQATDRLIKCIKLVAQDSKNPKTQQALSATNRDVTESVSRLVQSIKQAATGEVKCEEAIDSINRRISELDSAALYAATGELKPDSEDIDIEQVLNDMGESSKKIQDALKRLTSVAAKNQSELGNAASDAMEGYEKLTKEAKNVASQIPSLLSQQEILTGAKAVGITVQLAVTSGLNVHKAPDNAQLRSTLADASVVVSESLKELLAVTQVATNSSGIKDIESARKNVVQAIGNFQELPPNQKAGATDVLKAAKSITDSVATIYTAGSSSDDAPKIAAACNELKAATINIVQDSKGAVRLTDKESGRKLVDACKAALQSTASFLEAAKAQKKSATPDSQRAVSEANDDLVKMISDVVEAARPLPGSEEALKLFQETDELEALAESELLACATAIEDAAKTLVDAKRRQMEMRKNKESPLPEEEIQEAIIEAARAITVATATLVQSATVAQKELVAKGKAEKAKNLYRRDPAWAKGLISASQAVAGSVKSLVGAANTSVQGKTEEEALIASAKGVAAATARLVFASRTKADPFSPTQKKLSAAAKAVAEATKQLVEAAKVATVQAQETEARPDWDSLSDTAQKKAELEAQTKILKMQNELEKATKHLADIRKKEYAEATGKATPTPGTAQPTTQGRPQPPSSAQSPSRPTPAVKTASPASGKKGVSRVLPGEKFFTLEQLQSKPPECDPSKYEMYLTDDEFIQVFGIDKPTFAKQPAFKQTAAKRTLGIF